MQKLSILIYIIIFFHWNIPRTEGVKIRLTKAGLLFAVNLGIDLLANTTKTLKLPDFNGSSFLMSYYINNIKITNFVKPTAIVSPVAGGLSLLLTDTSLKITIDWGIKIGIGAFSIKNSGSGSVSSESIFNDLTILIERDANGRLVISETSCSCLISGFSISIAKSTIYNLVLSFFQKAVRVKIQNKLCENINKMINEDFKKTLDSMKTNVEIYPQILLDYKLTDNPVFTSEYIEATLAGEFYSTTGILYNKEAPTVKMEIGNNNKMVYATLTEHLFNSGGYVLHRLGFFNTTIPIKDSIGQLLGQTKGAKLLGKIEVPDPPIFKINASSFMIQTTVNAKVQKLNEDLLNIELALLISCDINFSGDRINGKVLSMVPEKIISRNNSSISTKALIVEGMIEMTLPKINEIIKNGFSIPVIHGFKYVSPILISSNGYATIGINVEEEIN